MRLIQFILGWVVSLAFFNNNKTTNPILISACGGFFCDPSGPVLQAGENIAFGVQLIEDEGSSSAMEVTMAVQINYEGPAEAFAWVLPVLELPDLSVGSELLFRGLFESTRPLFQFDIRDDGSNCHNDTLNRGECSGFIQRDIDFGPGAPAVEVLESGEVGPFTFSVIEAKEGNEDAVFDYLNTNGFDQPPESEELITGYAEAGMVFVTLKLTKGATSGDITPIVLRYVISDVNDLSTLPVSCVPLRLTRIAAVEAMPIQIYILGDVRATPYNYFHTILTDESVDWLGCGEGFDNQDCFLSDFRARFQAVVNEEMVNGRAFTTEFAGPLSVIDDISTLVEVDTSIINELYNETNATRFVQILDDIDLLSLGVVQSIAARYISVSFPQWAENCTAFFGFFDPDTNGRTVCRWAARFEDPFDHNNLMEELNNRVFIPASNAQEWIGNYTYVTRMYAQLDPDQMENDPIFIFQPNEPDISQLHRAVGVPYCALNSTGVEVRVGLNMFLIDENDIESSDPFYISAYYDCYDWVEDGVQSISLARELSTFGLSGSEGDASIILVPDSTTGQFDPLEIQDALNILNEHNMPVVVDDSTPTPAPPSDDPPTAAASSRMFLVGGSMVITTITTMFVGFLGISYTLL